MKRQCYLIHASKILDDVVIKANIGMNKINCWLEIIRTKLVKIFKILPIFLYFYTLINIKSVYSVYFIIPFCFIPLFHSYFLSSLEYLHSKIIKIVCFAGDPIVISEVNFTILIYIRP